MKLSKPFLFFSFFFFLVSSISFVTALSVNIPISTNYTAVNTNHSATADYSTTSGSSNFWDALDTPADIDHNLLNNLAWSVAGHTIDSNVDFDGNDLLNVDEADFKGPVDISQAGVTSLDIFTTSSTSYSVLEIANTMGYDVSLFMYGKDAGGTKYGFLESNLTVLDTDTPDDLGAFVIGNHYHNPLVFVTDDIPRLNITSDGNIEIALNISTDSFFIGDGSHLTGISGITDTNATTECGDTEYLRGDGTCQVIIGGEEDTWRLNYTFYDTRVEINNWFRSNITNIFWYNIFKCFLYCLFMIYPIKIFLAVTMIGFIIYEKYLCTYLFLAI